MWIYDWVDCREVDTAKVVAIVQARTTSKRFPMKIFADLGGRPMLAHVLERAAAIQGVDQVVLAVPENDVKLVAHLWPHVYGGSEKDVLSRYAGAAEKYEADVIIRLTGDNPLICPEIGQTVLDVFKRSQEEFVSNDTMRSGFPDGTDVQIFTRSLLVKAHKSSTTAYEREHVCPAMWRLAKPVMVASDRNLSSVRLTVDVREDLELVQMITQHLEHGRYDLGSTIQAYDGIRRTHPTWVCPLAVRLWSKMRRGDGCWEWQGCRTRQGYGVIVDQGKKIPTHRAVWIVQNGAIQAGMQVCHHCDNPPCGRPDHLFLGTTQENTADSVAKGRRASGDRHPSRVDPLRCTMIGVKNQAKLTETQIYEIRARCDNGETKASVARQFGVDRTTISMIALRKTWRHLPERAGKP